MPSGSETKKSPIGISYYFFSLFQLCLGSCVRSYTDVLCFWNWSAGRDKSVVAEVTEGSKGHRNCVPPWITVCPIHATCLAQVLLLACCSRGSSLVIPKWKQRVKGKGHARRKWDHWTGHFFVLCSSVFVCVCVGAKINFAFACRRRSCITRCGGRSFGLGDIWDAPHFGAEQGLDLLGVYDGM